MYISFLGASTYHKNSFEKNTNQQPNIQKEFDKIFARNVWSRIIIFVPIGAFDTPSGNLWKGKFSISIKILGIFSIFWLL